jgi:DNA replication protein DnaC
MKAALEKALRGGRCEPKREEESDLDFAKRKFDGKVFECRGCGCDIPWPGACDECREEFDEKTMTDFDRIRRIGVPFRNAENTWSSFQEPKGLKHTELRHEIKDLQHWRGDPSLAILSGRPGTGKTHMAVATVWRRLKSRGITGMRFYQERVLLEELKRGFDSSEGDDTLERVSKLDFLVIDDFGHSRMTEWVVDTMFGLVSRRFDEGKVTLVTTNLIHADINAIDPRLGSRLHEALTVGTSSMPDHRKGKPSGKSN